MSCDTQRRQPRSVARVYTGVLLCHMPHNDPRIAAIRNALALRAPRMQTRQPADREAAVALVLRPSDNLELLMIKRAERADDPWSGHMALPGGRRSDHDVDLLQTALRETREEVGLELSREDLIGPLDEVHPRSTRLPPVVVAAFVVVTDPTAIVNADPREVEAAVWVPLDALRDPQAVSELVIELGDFSRAFPSIVYGDYTIWGLTHAILSQFLEVAFDSSAS